MFQCRAMVPFVNIRAGLQDLSFKDFEIIKVKSGSEKQGTISVRSANGCRHSSIRQRESVNLMMEELEDDCTPPAEDLVECRICQRSFFPKVLEKHAKICNKTQSKRRKVFDSSRQRAEGTDISVLKPLKSKAEPPKKQSNWRKKHEDFIATIRAAKGITQVMKDGGPLPPPPPPTYDPDYVQCPFCQRRFNEGAADRHIKFCQEQAARMPNKGKLGEAKKPPARTQLKPQGPAKKVNSPAVSTIPSASSRLPQRSGLGQPTGIPPNRTSSAGIVRGSPSGLTTPPSGVGNKPRAVSSGYGPVRNTPPGAALNKKKADTYISRNDVDGSNDVGNGGMKSKFCHACGTKYPVESAKFCCECGIRRMCI
ncbi:zinc finger C2HC domain-containing protein 1A isoform X2 [Notolabrus celidotus]|uniref:zinc finger C2HC domain-containing protein 1A isoform X2 n=1 Tax=Notolabrus celidotus TaxID=1203425 RepID=UPI0014903EFB|nr:zinc finger C2HC domain-containing protein 1A isoform X2 [Notolabrus celidotus]